TLTIEDNTAPTITVSPSDLSVECDGSGNAGDIAAWLAQNGGAVANDLCSEVTWTNDYTSLSDDCGATGIATVTFTATDACGNATSASAQIIILDTTAPNLVQMAQDTIVECDGTDNFNDLNNWLANNGGAVASDACGGVTWTSDYNNLGINLQPCNNDTTGTLTVTFTATDECGNAIETTARFVVVDQTPPVLSNVPADITIECDAVPAPADVTASDICDANVDLILTENTLPGDCPGSYTLTRTWTATDHCGLQTSHTQTILVFDNSAPQFDNIPADVTVECDAVPTPPDVTATDNCDNALTIDYQEVRTDGACPDAYVLTRTWTATDNCGNAISASQTVTVEDTTPPVLDNLPAPNSNADCNVIPPVANVTATDNCDADVEIVFNETQTPNGCDGAFTLTRTWTATDNCGNSTEYVQVISAADNTPPELVNVPGDISVECDAIPAAPTDVTATDNCDSNIQINLTENTLPGGCPNEYTLVRTWTATDHCGNETTASQNIFVFDNSLPELTGIPADVTVECSAIPAVANPTASDNCTTTLSIDYQEVRTDGACADSYVLTRTWTVTDDCGNENSGSQIITVEDQTAPEFVSIPSDITVECDAVPAAETMVATDNCDSDVQINLTENTLPGGCPNEYTLVRTWTATDNCGNETIATQNVFVFDNSFPELTNVPADLTINCSDALPTDEPTVTDNCGSATLTLDIQTTPGTCPQESVVTKTWTATDDCGNANSVSQKITVVDTESPVLVNVPADLTLECDAALPTDAPVATDNCDADVVIDFVENETPGACPQSRVIVRTWTATDACGNASQGTQTITIEDTTAPVLANIPADVSIECDQPLPTDQPTVTDNCDANVVLEMTDTQIPGNCPQEITITRTWTATDACGNTATATQTIYMWDPVAPVFVNPPADITADCDFVPGAPADVTATDNCDTNVDIVFGETIQPGLCPESFIIERTWAATDDCGNTTVHKQIVSVGDNQPPVITGIPPNTNADCDAIPNAPLPTDIVVTDNCDANPTLEFSETTQPGTCTNSETIIRTWTATDACGNSTTATQTITVGDGMPPVISGVPADITAECSEIPAVPSDVTVSDNCDPDVILNFNETTAPGSCPAQYSLIRTWSATDACGNTTEVSQTIIVDDTTAPVWSNVPSDLTVSCDNIPVADTPVATDNCDPNVNIVLEENETPGACPQSRIITRTWTATDACGNTSEIIQTINVEDTEAPVITGVPGDISAECSAIPAADPNVTATDNCDPNVTLTVSDNPIPGACEGQYTLERTWTATDACGNQTSATQIIIVDDTTAPELVGVPADVDAECTNIPAPPASGVVTATDNCDTNVSITFEEQVQDNTCGQTITRTWTATDACGNSTSATQTINVGDTESPTLTDI
ncbi:MAG: hypothetical protein D6714_14120, partial [Bacteroidetes bacterium]